MDFDFDDDLFDCKEKKGPNDINEVIHSYNPKIVQNESFLNETSDELENTTNLLKLKADYYYYRTNFDKSLQYYKDSLALSCKSISLNNKIIQRELNESIARCLMNLKNFEEAFIIAKKLEETAQNFEAMSTSLNLQIEILENSDINSTFGDKLITIEKLIVLHPLFITFWMKLADVIYFNITNKCVKESQRDAFVNHYLVCFLTIKELILHGYQFRSDIVSKQKQKQKLWLSDAEMKMKNINIKMEKILSENFQNLINENLEKADKLEDNEKLMQARNSITHEHFSTKFFDDYKISIIIV